MSINQKMSREAFHKLVSKEPHKDDLVKETNGDSIPISKLEQQMDDVFGAGMWSRKIVQSYREINEFIVVVHVSYIHPVSGLEVVRSGIGAVPIQVSKNETELGSLNVNKKKTQALQYNSPAAQGFAFKNAVKSIGKFFGRDLLRGKKNPNKVANVEVNKKLKLMMAFSEAITQASTKEHITQIYFDDRFEEILIDPENMAKLTNKKMEITQKLLPNG